MIITIVTDNPDSWFVPYGKELCEKLLARGHRAIFCHQLDDVTVGDICFLLSCERITPRAILERNKHNIVIHSSALPKGKGMSPLTWQILEGKNDIPTTLLEAGEKVDSGDIYLQKTLHFEGHELSDEMKEAQGRMVIELALDFVEDYPRLKGEPQEGSESFYRRRKPEDSELDVDKSLAVQFNLLRVADNERYPAFFRHKGHIYILKIYKTDT